MTDQHRSIIIAYEVMNFCNPVSVATLSRVLAWAKLEPGMRALDLGCGNAAMSKHLAENYGLTLDALERSPTVAKIARRRLEGVKGVTLHNLESRDFLPTAQPYDLVLSIGASNVADGPPEPQAVMEALKPHVKPGGLILWADPYWKADPDPQFAAWISPHAAYKSHEGNIEAGRKAGLQLIYAGASSQDEWDDCAFSMFAAVQYWLDDHPDDPDFEDVRTRAEMQRAAYMAYGRDTLGFGLYLFRV